MKDQRASPEEIALLKAYTLDALSILQHCLELSGDCPAFYRVAALQMRLLLCDTTRRHGQVVSIATLPRLLPDLRLPAMDAAGRPDERILFPLSEWLNTPISAASAPVTPRQLIRCVCDQDGGAHVDLKPQANLRYLPSEETALWIYRLAQILLDAVLPLLRGGPESGDG